jgi:hypothetical protein
VSETPLVRRLQIRSGYRLAIVNAPADYLRHLGELPPDVTLSDRLEGEFDWVQVFVKDRAALDEHVPAAIQAVKAGGILWVAYPKRSSKVETDITRDIGWETMDAANWRGVAQVSIDDTWSALRFRPADEVGKK